MSGGNADVGSGRASSPGGAGSSDHRRDLMPTRAEILHPALRVHHGGVPERCDHSCRRSARAARGFAPRPGTPPRADDTGMHRAIQRTITGRSRARVSLN